jgi:hypothetical protein
MNSRPGESYSPGVEVISLPREMISRSKKLTSPLKEPFSPESVKDP